MNYARLRAEYDAAFERLRRAHWELQSIRQRPLPDRNAEESARQRFEQAMGEYRACRRRLADLLLEHQSAERSSVSKGTQSPRRHEIQSLAHHLWEEAGRPEGRAEEHWYRAETMLRSDQ